MAKKKKNHYIPKNKPVKSSVPKVEPAKKPSKFARNLKKYAIYAIIILVFGFIFVSFSQASEKNSQFAQCVADSDAKMYGASWCSACNQQKSTLGNVKEIPYVECSEPDGRTQTQICIDEGIEGYPTWKFADNTTHTGVLSKAELSERTGCVLP